MHNKSSQSPALFHLQWVAKVALLVGGVAAGALLLAIVLITDDNGTDYAHVLAKHSLTQHNLTPTLWAFGLALVVIAAVTTWLITLYSSFRMAGPLFRLSENLKSALANPLAIPLAIRKGDLLQHEWQQFKLSQENLRAHYARLHAALDAFEAVLAHGTPADAPALTQALNNLQEVEQRVKI